MAIATATAALPLPTPLTSKRMYSSVHQPYVSETATISPHQGQQIRRTLHHMLTPPQSGVVERQRLKVTLPSLRQLDQQLGVVGGMQNFEGELDHIDANDQVRAHTETRAEIDANMFVPTHIDWRETRNTRFIAEKTCEMICYLWFEPPSPSTKSSLHHTTSPLQLLATPSFISFMQKLLETTQVSHSVIVLSLHYIHRLKARNEGTPPPQPGSEFRIAVAGLMMANKFLDDNTYTNKTWSEVSGIELSEINRMECEFLLGVDFNLYVDKSTYESWLCLLKGLVLAKEREARLFRGQGRQDRGRSGRAGDGRRSSRRLAAGRERRSASPPRTLPTLPPIHTSFPSPVRPHGKRTADNAFSPEPERSRVKAPRIEQPTFGFERMSLASPPRTLVKPYGYTERETVPENLYFYTLGEGKRGRVRYHHPPPARSEYVYTFSSTTQPPLPRQPPTHWTPPARTFCHPSSAVPTYHTQSAITSPVGMDLDLELPPIERPPRLAYAYSYSPVAPSYVPSLQPSRYAPPPYSPSEYSPNYAPFANAGPPGVAWR